MEGVKKQWRGLCVRFFGPWLAARCWDRRPAGWLGVRYRRRGAAIKLGNTLRQLVKNWKRRAVIGQRPVSVNPHGKRTGDLGDRWSYHTSLRRTCSSVFPLYFGEWKPNASERSIMDSKVIRHVRKAQSLFLE